MSVYKRERSPFYQYDFEWNGSRYRGSTKQSSENKARIFEATLMAQLREEGILVKKSPTLENFSPTFLKWVDDSQQIKEKHSEVLRPGLESSG